MPANNQTVYMDGVEQDSFSFHPWTEAEHHNRIRVSKYSHTVADVVGNSRRICFHSRSVTCSLPPSAKSGPDNDALRDLNGRVILRLQAAKAEEPVSSVTADSDVIVTDVIDEMRMAMQTLSETFNRVPDYADEDSSIISDIEKAVDKLLQDNICNSDFPSDFYKFGGLELIRKLLSSPFPRLRVKGCELISETVRNNRATQRIIADAGMLMQVTRLLEHDANADVRDKALSAISGTITGNESACHKFATEAGGVDLFTRILDKDCKTPELRVRVSALISSLCTFEPIRELLFKLGLGEKLNSLLHQGPDPGRESIASAFRAVITCPDDDDWESAAAKEIAHYHGRKKNPFVMKSANTDYFVPVMHYNWKPRARQTPSLCSKWNPEFVSRNLANAVPGQFDN